MKKIVCFGEVLWDLFPDGKRIGGAPFNVAAHSKLLGLESSIVSCVGEDQLGQDIVSEAKDLGVDTDYLGIDPDNPTGTVKVHLDSAGQPDYEIVYPVAWDHIDIEPGVDNLVKKADAFVFGTLASRSIMSRASLYELLSVTKYNVLDLNIRQHYYNHDLITRLFRTTDFLKINDDELGLLQKLFFLDKDDCVKKLMHDFPISLIVVTKGSEGAEAFHKDTHFTSPGVPVEVVNTVGSGDAFLAAFLANYLNGKDIQLCLDEACARGAQVAGRAGAIT